MAFCDQTKPYPSRRQDDLLISAISLNDLKLVEKCVEQGADVNANWPLDHHSIFSKAVENGNVDIVRYLIRKKAELKKSALYGTYTPLVVAIRSNFSLPLVKLLVENGANVDEKDITGRTPLNEAIALNKDPIVEYLLINGADVNQIDGFGRLPITLAVQMNRFEIVKLLTLRGADINKNDSRNENALTLSRRLTDFSIFNYLEIFSQRSLPNYSLRVALKKKEDSDLLEVNGIVEEPETVSFVIVPRSNSPPQKDTASRNSRNNAKFEDEEEYPNRNPLDRAIFEDDLEKVELLLEDKDINKSDEDGFSPLAKAISFGKTQVVKHLLSLNADIRKTVNGKTLLLLAVEKGNLEIIKLLIENGAKDYTQTAFFEAINLGSLEIIKYFIEIGVELTLSYKNGYTPLTKSLEMRNFDVVKELVDNGANVNMLARDGKLPLVISLENGDSEIASYLYKKGAILTKSDALLFLQKYVESGDLKMLKLLADVLKAVA